MGKQSRFGSTKNASPTLTGRDNQRTEPEGKNNGASQGRQTYLTDFLTGANAIVERIKLNKNWTKNGSNKT